MAGRRVRGRISFEWEEECILVSESMFPAGGLLCPEKITQTMTLILNINTGVTNVIHSKMPFFLKLLSSLCIAYYPVSMYMFTNLAQLNNPL